LKPIFDRLFEIPVYLVKSFLQAAADRGIIIRQNSQGKKLSTPGGKWTGEKLGVR
jgi:hypothetical protein